MISLGIALPSITPTNPAINTSATAMTQVAIQMLNSLETYKSKTTKTK
jgi:hypothetical protein